MILIGQAGGSRLELLSAAARLPLQLSASTGAPSPVVKFGASLELKQGKLVIDASNADGFIATLLGGVKVESDFDLSALYDTDKGLRFTGSATIEIALPTHITLGPISIPNLYLIGGFKDGKIPVEFSVDLGAQLGPLAATVNRMGALATISFPKGGGNAGAAQIDVGFKPPNGVGLSVDAGVVKGGGFLFIDTDRGEYAGALELTFAGFLSLKAVGIINTRMPDGSSGFSLLIIISVEFGTGLQLGFGFTLIGVGGLLGLNRTMRLDALVEGVRTGRAQQHPLPERHRGQRHPDHQRPARLLPAAERHLPDRPDGQARLGHADPGQPHDRNHHRDPRQHRPDRRPAGRAADRRCRGRRPPGQLHRRDRVRQVARLVLRHPVRQPGPVHHHPGRDGPAHRLRRRRELRRFGGRLSSALLTARRCPSRRRAASPWTS